MYVDNSSEGAPTRDFSLLGMRLALMVAALIVDAEIDTERFENKVGFACAVMVKRFEESVQPFTDVGVVPRRFFGLFQLFS